MCFVTRIHILVVKNLLIFKTGKLTEKKQFSLKTDFYDARGDEKPYNFLNGLRGLFWYLNRPFTVYKVFHVLNTT